MYTLYAKTAGLSVQIFQKDQVSSICELETCQYLTGVQLKRSTSVSTSPMHDSAQDRLQLYNKKVAKVVYDTELAAAKRMLQLDVATANRFINAAMSDLPPAQREALRRVTLPSSISIVLEHRPQTVIWFI